MHSLVQARVVVISSTVVFLLLQLTTLYQSYLLYNIVNAGHNKVPPLSFAEVVEEFSDTAAHGVSSPVTSPVKKPPPESPSKVWCDGVGKSTSAHTAHSQHS